MYFIKHISMLMAAPSKGLQLLKSKRRDFAHPYSCTEASKTRR